MGGCIENMLEDLIIKLAEKYPILEPLKEKGERQVFSAHTGWHWLFGALVSLVGALTIKWIALINIPLFFLVWLAERKDGRLIDWISRGLGWVLGMITAIPVLVWG